MAKSILSAVSTAALLSYVRAQYDHPYGGQIVMYSGVDVAQRIDPILAPGGISQHVHLLFGSNAVKPDATYESLQTDTTCTTVGMDGDGIKDDNSAYWHPALYMETSNNTGYIRVPSWYHKLYYQDHGSLKDDVVEPFEFPPGFRMLANNPFQRAPSPIKAHQNRITSWSCHTDNSNTDVDGTQGGFPTGVSQCSQGFVGTIMFPHCWNGEDFNPLDPTAHMAYPDGDPEHGDCPDSHKKRVPHIFMENYFYLDKHFAPQVKPDSFVLAQGDNTGYGFHGDFLNGWKQGKLQAQFNRCNQYNTTITGIAACDDAPHAKHVSGQGGFTRNGENPNDCAIPITFTEDVDYPGQFLPGCNPVIDTDPAPIMAIAPLGVLTNQCSPIAGTDAANDTQAAPAYTSVSAAAVSSSPAPSSESSAAQVPAYSAPVVASPSDSPISTPPSIPSSSTLTSSPSASASASAQLKCPGDDGKQYTASNGKVFQVECGIDHVAGNLDMVYSKNFASCIEACASHDACVDVSLSGTACWMKKALGKSVQRGEVSGAKLVTGASSGSADLSAAGSSTTELLTTTTVVPTQTAGPYGGETVWVTEVVTVTAVHSVYARQPREEEVRAHMHKHAKYHVGRRAF